MKKLLHGEILSERLTNDEALVAKRHPISLFLDNIRSLYNVGSIFRTADSALAEEIILTGYTPAPPREEILKTALGAADSVPWKYFKDPIDGILYLKDKGVTILALELTDKKRYYDSIKFDEFPVCLVLGNELTGIDDRILKNCDDSVEIPMYGVKHSLNVSVATGIALFEAVKTWNKFND